MMEAARLTPEQQPCSCVLAKATHFVLKSFRHYRRRINRKIQKKITKYLVIFPSDQDSFSLGSCQHLLSRLLFNMPDSWHLPLQEHLHFRDCREWVKHHESWWRAENTHNIHVSPVLPNTITMKTPVWAFSPSDVSTCLSPTAKSCEYICKTTTRHMPSHPLIFWATAFQIATLWSILMYTLYKQLRPKEWFSNKMFGVNQLSKTAEGMCNQPRFEQQLLHICRIIDLMN